MLDFPEQGQTLAPRTFQEAAAEPSWAVLRQTRSERLASELADASIDVAKIEAIVAKRIAARGARNWAESDRLRDELSALGVAIKDNKDGTTTWEPKR